MPAPLPSSLHLPTGVLPGPAVAGWQHAEEAPRASEPLGPLLLSTGAGLLAAEESRRRGRVPRRFLPSSVLRRGVRARSAPVSLAPSHCGACSVKRPAAHRDGPHFLELGGCTAVALRAPRGAQAQQLPGTMHRRGDSSCKQPREPGSSAVSRGLQAAAQSPIQSRPTWLSGPGGSCRAFWLLGCEGGGQPTAGKGPEHAGKRTPLQAGHHRAASAQWAQVWAVPFSSFCFLEPWNLSASVSCLPPWGPVLTLST